MRRRSLTAGSGCECLLVASSGGHLHQLLELREGWGREQRTWVTFPAPDVGELLAGERVVLAHGPTNRSLRKLIRNAFLALRVVRRERPRVMVTTGAGIAVAFAYAAWLHGVPVIWVEGLGRVEGLSLSARLVAPVTSRLFVQWPELAERVGRAEYAGTVW